MFILGNIILILINLLLSKIPIQYYIYWYAQIDSISDTSITLLIQNINYDDIIYEINGVIVDQEDERLVLDKSKYSNNYTYINVYSTKSTLLLILNYTGNRCINYVINTRNKIGYSLSTFNKDCLIINDNYQNTIYFDRLLEEINYYELKENITNCLPKFTFDKDLDNKKIKAYLNLFLEDKILNLPYHDNCYRLDFLLNKDYLYICNNDYSFKLSKYIQIESCNANFILDIDDNLFCFKILITNINDKGLLLNSSNYEVEYESEIKLI